MSAHIPGVPEINKYQLKEWGRISETPATMRAVTSRSWERA